MQAPSEVWPRDALPHGTALHGFVVEAILGRGGFGITYRVRDRIDQLFAVKECFPKQFAVRQGLEVLPTDESEAPALTDCLERFMREAKALTRLSQRGAAGDGVVKVMTFFEAHGTAYIVMEHLAGQSLETLLRASPGGIDAGRLTDILRGLLHALGCVHDAELLHRDIKPANVFLREDGRPVLIDFGATRAAGTSHTVTYTQIFSEAYAPIEQFAGGRQGTFSDIYALGMTCYRLIGGTAMDAFSRQQALLRGKPDPLLSAATIGVGRYPPGLLAVIDAALRVAPDDRPQDVAQMLARLSDDERPTTIVHPVEAEPPVSAAAVMEEEVSPPAPVPGDPDETLRLTPRAEPAVHPVLLRRSGGRTWAMLAAALIVILVVIGGIGVAVNRSAPTGNPLLAGMTAETGRDYAQAMRWYREADDQGDQNAPYQIGALYARGLGVARDCAAARTWFDKAAAGSGGVKRWLPWYEECPAR
jgi:serine/threonine protein kinase